MRFLVGTLTRLGGPGVAMCVLENDTLRAQWAQGGFTDPNWITGSRFPGRVYFVSSDWDGDWKGCVRQATVTASGLKAEKPLPTGGASPCHIAVSGDERFLTVANYGTGSVAVFSIGQNGLEERIQHIQWTGSGADPARQEGPHAHYVTYLPGMPDCLCVTDLGTDQLYVYHQDAATGLLSLRYRLRCPGGEGPRHIVHGRDASFLLTEMGAKVFAIRFHEDGGEISQGVSMLPEGYAGKNTAAAIRLSPDGHTLYASNRGHDSIAVCDVEWRGAALPTVGRPRRWIATEGGLPRDFAVLPDGALLAACQSFGLTLMRDGECVCRLPLMGAVCLLEMGETDKDTIDSW